MNFDIREALKPLKDKCVIVDESGSIIQQLGTKDDMIYGSVSAAKSALTTYIKYIGYSPKPERNKDGMYFLVTKEIYFLYLDGKIESAEKHVVEKIKKFLKEKHQVNYSTVPRPFNINLFGNFLKLKKKNPEFFI